MTKAAELGERQAIFVKEYLIDLNAKQAAIRAGYSAKTAEGQGSRLLRNAQVRLSVEQAQAKRSERLQITSDYVLEGIRDTVERCRQSAPILDRQGRQVFVKTPRGDLAAAYTFDSKGVLKGFELLGRHLKLFTDRQELTGRDGEPVEIKKLVVIDI